MSYFVCRETVIEGGVVKSEPFVTEHEARMALANEVEAALVENLCYRKWQLCGGTPLCYNRDDV